MLNSKDRCNKVLPCRAGAWPHSGESFLFSMQTAAIPYRVADFLKQHPPFQFMDELELVALAARGRVKFHESDEYICWQGAPHTPFVYVIQQGSVLLWDESVDPPALRDIRGAGDIIGIECFSGSQNSLHSVKTASDVVLYALYAEDLEPLLARHPLAAQYVAAYSAVTADFKAPDEPLQPHEIFLADLVKGRAPVHCAGSISIREAAHLLSESGEQVLALTNGGELAALLSTDKLLDWIAAGARNCEAPAQTIAQTTYITLPPQTTVSDGVLAMAESRASAAAVTRDSSPHTMLQWIVTVSSLTPAFGDHPLIILEEIASAPAVNILRSLHERARAWILERLSPLAMEWLASFGDLVNRRIVERLLQITADHSADRLVCFCGAAGRRELLTKVAPRIAVIGDEIRGLESELTECGFISVEPPGNGSLDEWKTRFSGWIRDPIDTRAYLAHAFFDLRRVHGPAHLFTELESHIRAELAVEASFIRILAHDCLSNLPPLTFFHDLVVEESGEKTDTFRLEHSALQPLVDVARVFSLASGYALGASTRLRFEEARRRFPSRESIFREAAETTSVVLFHQARAGLRLNSSGAELPLSIISRHDRQILKSGFRSIHNLLEFTGRGDWLDTL
jgi:CBS domain-containing protein